MTEQEQAIETLRKISDIETSRNYVELHEIKSFNYDLVTGISALEKQIPKKPIYSHFYKEYKCHCCGIDISFQKQKYCCYCGQKSDWSEEE